MLLIVERQAVLQPLIDFIQHCIDNRVKTNLNFICTHNSRRSHLSQVWAQTMAAYFNIENVFCYSGGTEATAIYTAIIATLKATGFQTEQLSKGNNPIYSIKFNTSGSSNYRVF